MHAVSWNLFGLSDQELDARSESAVMEVILGGPPTTMLADEAPSSWASPEIIMFQEVVDRSLHAHLLPHLQAAGYACYPDHAHRSRRYYELLAVRAPLVIVDAKREALDSMMGRELLEVEARDQESGLRWRLMTGHLESMASGRAQRLAQVAVVRQRLKSAPGPALFGGDTNLRDDEVEGMPDAWEACGEPADTRGTYISRSGTRRRYDRFWGSGVRFTAFHCIGREPIRADGPMPSDHLGIAVGFRTS